MTTWTSRVTKTASEGLHLLCYHDQPTQLPQCLLHPGKLIKELSAPPPQTFSKGFLLTESMPCGAKSQT